MADSVEHHIEVPRTARYWSVGPESGDAVERWIVLHGYKQLARRFLRRFETLASKGVQVVAPEALSRFYAAAEPGRHGPTSIVGATWMTREDRLNEIRDYVRYLDLLHDEVSREGPDVPLTVLGFSQGVATASRWTVEGQVRPRRLLLWGDFLPPDLDYPAAARAWSGTEVVLVRGDGDPALANVRLRSEEAERLVSAGLSPGLLAYEGGHDIDGEILERLAAS